MFDYRSPPTMRGEFYYATDAINEAQKIILDSFDCRDEQGYQEWLCFGESVKIIAVDDALELNFDSQSFVQIACKIKTIH